MNESRETEMKDIVEELAEDRGRTMKRDEGQLHQNEPPGEGIGWRPIAIAAAVLAVLLALGLILFSGGNGDSITELNSLNQRLDRVETRLRNLERVLERVTETAGAAEELNESVSRLESEQRSILDHIDGLARKVEELGRERTRAPAEPEPATGTHTVKRGETLFSISRRYGMSVDELCRLNGIGRGAVIRPGQELTVNKGE